MDAGMQLSEGQSRINGLAVSRALGDHFVKEHYPVTAEPFVSDAYKLGESDDKLVVASDGVSFTFLWLYFYSFANGLK